MIEITIDGKKIKTEEGKTILEVASENDIRIPSLCHHSDLKPKEGCRLCVVEIEGERNFMPACATKIRDGMNIITQSEELNRTRKTNLELIFSQHIEKCGTCIWSNRCKMLSLAEELDIRINLWEDRKKDYPKFNFGPSIIFDSSKCINCLNCVEACPVQYLEYAKKGDFMEVFPSLDKNIDCIYCGQCAIHCPSGAFSTINPEKEVEAALLDKKKTVVFQFAPSIRSSIGEEFGYDWGEVVIEKMVGAMKELGAEKVFDVSTGADLTTIEEAKELIERLEGGKNLPMMTSCCPAWVKYIEFYRPEMIPNLTTVRSPQIILGGLIKTYWAQKEGLDPKDIVVVSVMPCTSKKYEIKREELKIDGVFPVDFVLTTHEFAKFLIKKGINLKTVKAMPVDHPLGEHSGAGVIFGASGGVMESALREASKLLDCSFSKIEFKQARGMQDIKEAEIDLKGAKLKIAVVNGLKNLDKINLNDYHYVEVMACPGGCIGGGGQPIPTSSEIRKKRAQALYNLDKKNTIRVASDNPLMEEVYESFLKQKDNLNKVSYTKFFKKNKEN